MPDPEALRRAAERVLDDNWIGASTKPSARLYPHQWSWDSAFIAIGNAARGMSDRAVIELETLFRAQWSNGMVPHMVFDLTATDYHPSPETWGTSGIAAMPSGVVTSGMMQPAVHARAVRRVTASLHADERHRFLRGMVPLLEAWHEFLHRDRMVDGLIEIHHPWESGMDNSPLWDDALAAVNLSSLPVPGYKRVDTSHAPAEERPTTEHYDRYMAILEQMRLADYQSRDATALPFRVCDVLTNAVAADADVHLAALQRELGADDSKATDRADALTSAMQAQMWDDEFGMFVDLDRVSSQRIGVRAAAGLLPLALPIDEPRRQRLLETAHAHVVQGPHGAVVPTVAENDPTFEPRRYWRGPVWVNITWLLIDALRSHHPSDTLAEHLRSGVLELVHQSGCNEYFDPMTGDALGAERFSWTAALVLDLLD